MKKVLLLVAAGFFAGSLTNTLYSQVDTMRTLPPVIIYAKSNVTEAVTAAFEKRFKNASDERWFKIDKNFLVSFITGDLKNNALFKQNGRMVYHIAFGNEKNLPQVIKDQVMGEYADYNITTAAEVHIGNRDVWVINLEGMKKYVTVRVEDGELQEVQTFTKAG
jgi:hypothetical protein